MLKVKSTTLRRFGGFTIKFYFIHCSIPPPNFDTSAICRISAKTLIHKAYKNVFLPFLNQLNFSWMIVRKVTQPHPCYIKDATKDWPRKNRVDSEMLCLLK